MLLHCPPKASLRRHVYDTLFSTTQGARTRRHPNEHLQEVLRHPCAARVLLHPHGHALQERATGMERHDRCQGRHIGTEAPMCTPLPPSIQEPISSSIEQLPFAFGPRQCPWHAEGTSPQARGPARRDPTLTSVNHRPSLCQWRPRGAPYVSGKPRRDGQRVLGFVCAVCWVVRWSVPVPVQAPAPALASGRVTISDMAAFASAPEERVGQAHLGMATLVPDQSSTRPSKCGNQTQLNTLTASIDHGDRSIDHGHTKKG